MRSLAAYGWCVSAALACAGTQEPSAASLPVFGEGDAALFDDGVDLVEDAEGVGGSWQEEWESELSRRVESADMVAVGSAHTLRTDLDLDRRTSYRLVMRLERMLKGPSQEGDLTLLSREGARGYSSVDGAKESMLERRFVIFVRRYRGATGAAATHWHLSPASDSVVRKVMSRVEQEGSTFREVHVIERRE